MVRGVLAAAILGGMSGVAGADDSSISVQRATERIDPDKSA